MLRTLGTERPITSAMLFVSKWKRYSALLLTALWKVAFAAFALIGFLWVAGDSLARIIVRPLLFETEVVRRVPSPDRSAEAQVEVTRGGFGTVWTTRVRLGPQGLPLWIVYETSDSMFVPPLRWVDRNTVLIGLPCGRFDYLSNPDDWDSGVRSDRLRIRFEYIAECR